MKVKICGLTCLDDARAALAAGADLLGFNFYPPSPRYLTPAAVPPGGQNCAAGAAAPSWWGCLVNTPAAQVQEVMRACESTWPSFRAMSRREELAVPGARALKALRPANAAALAQSLARYARGSQGSPASAADRAGPAWLADGYRPGEFGGTGQAADWDLARDLAAQVPILLAGGLRPDTVAAAVRAVRPWGVDVASGVEAAPGRKDFEDAEFCVCVCAAEMGAV